MNETHPTIDSSRAWYGADVSQFLETDATVVLGTMAERSGFALVLEQRDAWLAQFAILKQQLPRLDGTVFMEFAIPRMGRRIDVVLVTNGVVFAIEFKVGAASFDRSALDQVWDYALDLKNFHQASHDLTIAPLLVATASSDSSLSRRLLISDDQVLHPIGTSATKLRETIDQVLRQVEKGTVCPETWVNAPYCPTPTIIEAARALYAQHSVEAIARYDAGAQNLRTTSRRIEELVDEARAERKKAICFVTGVPGAGKTLVGLNVATRRRQIDEPTHAVFLSGNGPLVAVLREALTRDEVDRKKSQGIRVRKGKVAESVKAFIQNVHHFRDDQLSNQNKPPYEHVAIFDEAQRAWDLQETASFMQRKKGHSGFSQSEPEFLISCLDRHADWAVIVCLVGGGQEINRGEAGIDEWLSAINAKFPHWNLFISSRLSDREYAAGEILSTIRHRTNTHFDDSLHLRVSMRSFRAENVSAFVKAVLDGEREDANRTFATLADRYPIVLSRNLAQAKQWIRGRARGTERFGLVASSKAQRLKPDAIDIRVDVDPVHWFLNDKEDTRSSYYLEDAATEFQVQGLELDWTCVAWDGDLRFAGPGWSYHHFKGNRWQNVNKPETKRYLCNAYRVLLTRARQGMVIYVPQGDPADHTRAAAFYDPTFDYLKSVGIPELADCD